MIFGSLAFFAMIGVYVTFLKIKHIFVIVYRKIKDDENMTQYDFVPEDEEVFEETYSSRSHGVGALDDAAAAAAAGNAGTTNDVGSRTDEPRLCYHNEVSWRGTNQRQWQWKCMKCLKTRKVKKIEGRERPNPADLPALNPFHETWEKRKHRKELAEDKIRDCQSQTILTQHVSLENGFYIAFDRTQDGAWAHVSVFDDRS